MHVLNTAKNQALGVSVRVSQKLRHQESLAIFENLTTYDLCKLRIEPRHPDLQSLVVTTSSYSLPSDMNRNMKRLPSNRMLNEGGGNEIK